MKSKIHYIWEEEGIEEETPLVPGEYAVDVRVVTELNSEENELSVYYYLSNPRRYFR